MPILLLPQAVKRVALPFPPRVRRRRRRSSMKLKGIHVPHKKNTAGCAPERIPVPKLVTIPMSMHIGRPAKLIVKRGDAVKVGQLIAEA
ncbi:MAG: hypothetical protein II629_02770, partial [Ruminococcus sp.]|nr:hypothetical protein [Ruminococcus sp.]